MKGNKTESHKQDHLLKKAKFNSRWVHLRKLIKYYQPILYYTIKLTICT